MAQRPTADYPIDPNVTSGTDLSGILNRFQDAIESGNSGASRPAYLEAGGLWVQTGDPMRLFFYNGTSDEELFNTTDGVLGIEHGTDIGQVTTWNGSAWTPYSSLTLDSKGDAYLSGTVNASQGAQLWNIAISGNTIHRNTHSTAPGIAFRNTSNITPTDNSGTEKDGAVDLGIADFRFKDAYFSGTVNAAQFRDANGPIISAFTMVKAFRKIKNAVADETTVEGIKESLTNVLGGLIEEFESIGTQES